MRGLTSSTNCARRDDVGSGERTADWRSMRTSMASALHVGQSRPNARRDLGVAPRDVAELSRLAVPPRAACQPLCESSDVWLGPAQISADADHLPAVLRDSKWRIDHVWRLAPSSA